MLVPFCRFRHRTGGWSLTAIPERRRGRAAQEIGSQWSQYGSTELHLLLREPGGVAERLLDVFAVQVRVAPEHLIEGCPVRDLADHDRDPNPHAPDARAAAHDVGIECDAIEHGSTPCPSPLRFLDRSETQDAAPPVERWSRPQLRQMLHPNQDRWVAGGQPERPARLLERAELLDSHQSSRRANFAFRSAASAWSIGRNVSFFIR